MGKEQMKTIQTERGTRAILERGTTDKFVGFPSFDIIRINDGQVNQQDLSVFQDATCIKKEDFGFNAHHGFSVYKEGNLVGTIKFQNGPIRENGYNGVTNEDLINIVKERLTEFQASEFNCNENAEAIYHLTSALNSLESRTKDRKARNVEGTYKK